MDEYKFELKSYTKFSQAYSVVWHEFDNTIQIEFADTNEMHKNALDMVANQERLKVTIDVYSDMDIVVRNFNLTLLPLKFLTPKLYSDFDTSVLSVTFKIISSEVTFVDTNE